MSAATRGYYDRALPVYEQIGGKTLVVMDDVWENGIETVKLLQRAMPLGSQILITTRQEQVAKHRELQAWQLLLEQLTDDEARALLKKLITHPAIMPEHIEKLVALLQGHPLTIEIAASDINLAEDARHIADILAEYEEGIRQGSPFDTLPETPKILNVVFGRSYDQLTPEAQQCFRALGVMATDAAWQSPIAAAVWQHSDEKATRTLHQTLRTRSLIDHDNDAAAKYGDTWYKQHPLLRSYARALLQKEGELDAAFGRYADFVTTAGGQFDNLPQEQWGVFDPLLPHIQFVGDTLTEKYNLPTPNPSPLRKEGNQTPPLLQERGQGGEVEMQKGQGGEGETVATQGRGMPRPYQDDIAQKILAFAYAVTLFVTRRPLMIDTPNGRERRGLNWLIAGADAAGKLDEKGKQATLLNNIGGVWDALGEKRKALAFYEQALPLFSEVGDKSGEATTLNNIGSVWDDLGEKRTALAFYEQALPMHREVGNKTVEATTLNNIGMVWSALGEKRTALDYFEQALPMYQEMGDKSGEATTLNNIGGVWDALGEKRTALDYLEQALLLDRETGDKSGEATTLNNMANIYLGEKRFDEAAAIFRQIILVFQQLGAVAFEAGSYANLAVTLQRQGHLPDAIASLETAIAILKKYNLPQDPGGVTVQQYEALLARWKGETPSQEAQAQFIQQIIALYRQGGADAVRDMFKGQVPDEVIEMLLAQLGGGDAS